jgi:hypothetical protein
MLSNRIFTGCLAILCFAGIIFSITGRLAVHQVSRHNIDSIRTVVSQFATNSLPDSRSDFNVKKLEMKLEQRVALSQVSENWDNVCTLVLECAIGTGILLMIVSFRLHKRSNKNSTRQP